jgi:LacI family transcriptional regulator
MRRTEFMALTIKDIAKMANTSTATVSRAIHGLPGIGEDKRKQMLELLDRIGYRPNRIAQNLVSGHSNTIGVITSDLTIGFYIEAISHIEHLCKQRGYQILVMDSKHDVTTERENIESLRQYRAEGILIIPEYDYNMRLSLDHFTRLRLEKYPFALIGKSPQHDVDWVTMEEIKATTQVIDHLLDLGHTRIGYLGNDTLNRPGMERMEGIQKALHARDLVLQDDFIIDEVGTWDEGGEEAWHVAIENLFSKPAPPTALFCANDTIALIALSKLQSMGIEVPNEVSITGFDDSPWSRYVRPSLTTCAKDMVEVGRLAVEVLFHRMEHPDAPVQQILVPHKLMIRASSGVCVEKQNSCLQILDQGQVFA